MGASEDKELLKNLDNLFKNRLKGDFNNSSDKVDVILYTSQECKKSLKMERIDTLESYFNANGYSNIDTDFSGMWEMFLMVFVRNELLNDVTKVKKQQIAKGKNGLVVTFGNKGGVAYNFKLKNIVFTAIATHLQHK